MKLIKEIMTKFDLWCAGIGKTNAYKRSLWWYITQYNYIGIGMGKFYNIRQVVSFFVYGEIIIQGIEKITTVPSILRDLLWISFLPVTFGFWLIGRFLDYSKSLHLENEWNNVRNPAMIELRGKKDGRKDFRK